MIGSPANRKRRALLHPPRITPSRAASTPRPCVVVTTYARPDGLALLLDDVERDLPVGGVDLRVYDDATPNPDRSLVERVRARGWTYRRASAHHGKRGWWHWWNVILDDLRREPAQLVYVLQDDMRLCERFFARSAELWSSIHDPRKASLYLHLSTERSELGGRCWTPVAAVPAGRVVRSGWVDCAAFLCDRRLFEELGWRLRPVDGGRRQEDDLVSSGVGRQLSVRAHELGLGLYRVEESLTVHDGGPSLMNPQARERWPMDTVRFVDGEAAARSRARRRPPVFASLATIPRRERGLARVVDALLPQVDGLGVYLNGYERVPAFLEREGIVVARSEEHGVRGDAGKFFWAGRGQGYRLVCDDDIRYPEDYADRLVEGIERHGRRAVVGFHGCLLPAVVDDYHASRRLLHLSRALPQDVAVHVLGTGVAGYHVSALPLTPGDFPVPNMADIWLALVGQRRRVPFVCLRRSGGWLAELPGFRRDSIYRVARGRAASNGATPGPETRAILEHGRWELHGRGGDKPAAASARAARARPPAAAPRRARTRPLVRVRVTGPKRAATLVLPDRDHITEAIRRTGTYYERDLLDAIRARGVRGAFVDVGAHYGNHTAFFALECGAERVVALEPDRQAFAGLLETLAENGMEEAVTAHRVAAHPQWREVSVRALPWRSGHGASARTNSGRTAVAPAPDGGDAPAAPLDHLLDGIRGIGLVKVDAAGLSAEILASGRRTLRRDRPLVAAEAGTDAARHRLRAVLSSLGYRELARYCWTPTWLWEPVEGHGRSRA